LLLRAKAANGRAIRIEELRSLVEKGLRQYGLADLVQVEIEITDHVAPDPKSGKLKRITSLLGPPNELGEISQNRVAS
jgi:hypothetical protein